jgi:uncharacterized protein (TIRG00374 family)
VLVVVFVLSNWNELTESLGVIGRLPFAVFAVTLIFVCLTFALAAMSYRMLALRPLSFHELFTVELAAACINRLVPSGIGGLGVHGLYLHRRKHTVAQATAVVSINNLLGMLVHVTLLTVLLLLLGNATGFHFTWGVSQTAISLGAAVLVGIMLSMRSLRRRAHRFLCNLAASLARYKKQPHMLVFATLALLALTLTNLLVLHLVANAVGVELEVTKLFIVYSAGVLVGAVVPTPGGLAGVEAGLVAGFIAYGVPAELAVAAALAFRLATYWFPLVPGAIAFAVARTKKLV